MPTLYTVKSASLLREAAQLEADAVQSLHAWVLTRQYDKYGEAMATARVLRRAAMEPSIYTRREILRNAGFTIQRYRFTA